MVNVHFGIFFSNKLCSVAILKNCKKIRKEKILKISIEIDKVQVGNLYIENDIF